MGKVVRKATSALGLTGDPNAGMGAYNQSIALQARAVKELEKLEIPSIEAQRIILERPELVEILQPEVLERTAFEDIVEMPGVTAAQVEGLAELKMMSKEGFTPEDQSKFRAYRDKAAGDEQARQSSILASMAQRGTLDSGAQLASQLSSSQSAAQRDLEAADRMAMASADARRQALGQATQLAGQMRGQQWNEQATQARAKDAISQFNLAQRAQAQQRNIGERQRLHEKGVSLTNQQQIHNVGLQQQKFQNELAKATGMSGAISNQAQSMAKQGAAQAQAEQMAAAGTRQILLGSAEAMAKGSGGGAADGGIKYADGGFSPTDKMVSEREVRDLIANYGVQPMKEGLNMLDDPSAARLHVTDRSQEIADMLRERGITDDARLKTDLEQLDTIPNQYDTEQRGRPYDKARQDLHQRIFENIEAKRQYAEGGMAYEDGGEGTIIPGESYAGDHLEDRINSGEMVLNLDQQEKLNEDLQELKRMREGRSDEAVDTGEAMVNQPQQEALMSYVRGEMPLEALPEEPVVSRTQELEGLLSGFQNGGIQTTPDMIGRNVLPPAPQSTMPESKLRNMSDYEQILGMLGQQTREPAEEAQNAQMRADIDAANDIVQAANVDPMAEAEQDQKVMQIMDQIQGDSFQDGGISHPSLADSMEEARRRIANSGMPTAPTAPTSSIMSEEEPTLDQQEVDLQSMIDTLGLDTLEPEQRMSEGEPAQFPNMSIGEPAKTSEAIEAPITEAPKKKPESKGKSKGKTDDKSDDKPKGDKELEDAQFRDRMIQFLHDLNKGMSYYDAASPVAKLTPVDTGSSKPQAEAKLRQARKIAADQAYKDRMLDIQETSAEEGRKLKREGLDIQREGLADKASERIATRESKEADRTRKLDDQKRRYIKDIYGVRKDYKNDKVVSELRKQDISFSQAERLLEQMENDNKVAVGALGTKMARAMGEVGVLTDEDVIRYIGSEGISRKVEDFFSKKFKGKLSNPTTKDLRDINAIMKIGADRRIKEIRENYMIPAYVMAEQYGIEKTIVDDMFGSKRYDEYFKKKPKEDKKEEATIETKSPYPKIMYKDGQQATISNANEENEAKSDGWR